MGCEWEDVLFENAPLQILDGDRGKNYPKRTEFKESGHCIFLNTGNVTKEGFNLTSLDCISKERDELLRKGKLQREDVVLTTRGTVGNVAYFNGNIPYEHIRINSGMVILRPDPTFLHPRYLHLFVRSLLFKIQVEALSTGSAQPQLPIRDIKRIRVNFPPLPEQKAIAHVLGALDDRIELNRRMNEILEGMAQALFKSWFVDFDPVIDNALASGKEIPEELRERAAARAALGDKRQPLPEEIRTLFPNQFTYSDELGWIPQGWEVSETGDLFDVRDGTHDSPKQVPEGKYLITSRHITGGMIDFLKAYFISEADFEQVNRRSKVDSYDILLTMIGTVGVPLLVLEDTIDFAIKNIGLFKVGQDKRLAVFFFLYLKTPFMTHFLDSRMAGTTQKYLTLKILRSLPVLTPSKELMQRFGDEVLQLFKKVHKNNIHNGNLSKLRDTLLPKLLSGELRIPDAEKMVEELA